MQDLEFRPISDADVAAVAKIYNYYVHNTTVTFHIGEVSHDDMRGILFSGDPRYPTWALWSEGAIAGYVLITPYKKREAYRRCAEITVYLAPDKTGRGFGRAAVEHAQRAAADLDFHTLLAVISGDNEASIGLFRGCGYTECARMREVGVKFGKILDVVVFQKIFQN